MTEEHDPLPHPVRQDAQRRKNKKKQEIFSFFLLCLSYLISILSPGNKGSSLPCCSALLSIQISVCKGGSAMNGWVNRQIDK